MKKSEVIFVGTLGIMSISETNNRTYIRLTSQSTTNHAPSNRPYDHYKKHEHLLNPPQARRTLHPL
jgi:hypothetical protein